MGGTEDVNYAIIRLARAHRTRAGALLGRFGLHPGQEVVLTRLAEQDGRTPAELAACAGVEPGTMSRTLSALERAGYLTRESSCLDRRAVHVRLTRKGRAVQTEIEAAWGELAAETTAGLSDADRQTLIELLTRAQANLARHP